MKGSCFRMLAVILLSDLFVFVPLFCPNKQRSFEPFMCLDSYMLLKACIAV